MGPGTSADREPGRLSVIIPGAPDWRGGVDLGPFGLSPIGAAHAVVPNFNFPQAIGRSRYA